jgi:disulfide bond formation protein DsbB
MAHGSAAPQTADAALSAPNRRERVAAPQFRRNGRAYLVAMVGWILRHWPVCALAISAAMLVVAHAFEYYGYQPCLLCLRQREIYWAAMAVAAAALASRLLIRLPVALQVADVLLGLVFLTGAVVATYHAGVEWKLWPGPGICSGGVSALDTRSILAALSSKQHAPACDEAAWRMAGLSMAGYNALASIALAMASVVAASLSRGGEDPGRAD